MKENPAYKGRLAEASIGDHLYRETISSGEHELYYWNAGGDGLPIGKALRMKPYEYFV
ncbi:MAG: hypothetical protein GQ565_03950 [Candidatus Aegiribacteria sp.]|nr:hypothetical protein [Candidatus Aegiribacteria sp.]